MPHNMAADRESEILSIINLTQCKQSSLSNGATNEFCNRTAFFIGDYKSYANNSLGSLTVEHMVYLIGHKKMKRLKNG